MTSKDFCVWLRGYLEALGDVGAELEIERIKKELDGVLDEAPLPEVVHYPYYPPITRDDSPHYPYRVTCDGRTTSGG